MKQSLTKSELSKVNYSDLTDAFNVVKSGKESPEKIEENIVKRNIVFYIKSYCRKYQVNIENILSLTELINKIELEAEDLYDLQVVAQINKILKSQTAKESDKLYGYILNTPEEKRSEIIKNYILAIDNSAIVQIIDKNGIVKYVNDIYREISGDDRNIVGINTSSMGGKLYQDKKFWQDMRDTILSGKVWKGVIRNPKVHNKLDSYFTYTTITPITDDNGEIIEFITIKFDITQLKEIEKKLTDSNKRFHNIIDSTSEGFWVINEQLEITDLNNSLCDMLGYKKEEIIGKQLYDFLDEDGKEIIFNKATELKSTTNRVCNINLIKKDGTQLPIILKSSSLFDKDGNFQEAIAFITDISEIKEYQKKLYEISIRDELTGLWNRRFFDQKLGNYFGLINKGDGNIENISLCLIDIDFFKRINDGLGHDVGDIVLKEFGKRLLHISKENIEIFRIGGEEFGIIGKNIPTKEFERIIDDFREFNQNNPVQYSKGEINFTISGGITHYDISKTKIQIHEDLFKKADVLLYAAKNDGRNNIKTPDDM